MNVMNLILVLYKGEIQTGLTELTVDQQETRSRENEGGKSKGNSLNLVILSYMPFRFKIIV